jgi:hypothetical protein
MSDGGRRLSVDWSGRVEVISNVNAQRSDVRSIAWLGNRF